MKRKFRLFRSVRMRSIALFLAFLVPVYSTGALIYLWGRETIEAQTKDAQLTRVSYMIEGMEAEFARIRELQYSFFSDVFLSRLTDTLSIMSNYERDMCIVNISNRLATILNSNRYIREITVLIPSIDRRISTTAAGSLQPRDFEIIDEYMGVTYPESFFYDGAYWLYAAAHVGFNPADRDMPKYCLLVEISSRELGMGLTGLQQDGEEYIYAPTDLSGLRTSLLGTGAAKDLLESVRAGGGEGAYPESYSLGGESYLIFGARLNALGLNYISLVSERVVLGPINTYLTLFALFSVVTLAIIFLFSYYVRRSIHLPLMKLLGAFHAVEKGNLDTRISRENMDEFFYIYNAFNDMTWRLSQLINQVYRHKMLAQEAELKQLQAQINPHFLFNSFFMLKRRMRGGDLQGATQMADALGEYFQFITRSAASVVPLGEEVAHARIYALIQGARFKGRIDVSFEELPEEYAGLMVERLILQPIIENAFEHGLEDKRAGGVLKVGFERREGTLVISVEDDGDALSDEDIFRLRRLLEAPDGEISLDNTEVTGMINIHRRLRYRMGAGAGLAIGRGELGGLKVELRLDIGEYVRDGDG